MNRERTCRDDGAALPLALVLTLIALIIGSSLMLLAQTETYASMNYQSMTQARFAAESAVHKSINYLLNTYQAPGTASDPFNAYTVTTAPVKYNNNPVVLSARSDVTANYPVAATQAQFHDAAKGTLTVGTGTVQYAASAQLIAMRMVTGYGTGAPSAVQTWLITGVGTTTGARAATVEVSATLERQAVPFNLYGLFATAATCGALSFAGGVVTDSYNSSSMTFNPNGAPVTTPNGGNVGTNGNLTEGGGSVVNGSLSTPRTGVGNCQSGAVDALTQNGNAIVTGGMIQLPQAVTYQTPALPNPLPATGNQNITGATTCGSAGFPAGTCSGPAGALVLTPTTGPVYAPDLKLTAGAVLHLKAGTYNFNSISLQGNSQLIIDSGPVVMNVVGTGQTNPIDFSGGSVSNASYIPKQFQVLYGGTGGVKVSGGAATALMVFAPNASVALTGGSGVYGSVLGKTIQDQGGTAIHYDRDLPTEFTLAWNTMLSSFTWKKY
jgi:Tfp pilus assembly protein PilX